MEIFICRICVVHAFGAMIQVGMAVVVVMRNNSMNQQNCVGKKKKKYSDFFTHSDRYTAKIKIFLKFEY